MTEDEGETDLDIGHYERFLDQNLSRTRTTRPARSGTRVIRSERKGEYLGSTVQVIPHITNEIKDRIRRAAEATDCDVVITEIGGTVGDIESLPFLEAIRQFRREAGPRTSSTSTSRLCPFIDSAGELKTKPTQHSVNELRRIGIHPDIVVCRSREPLSTDIRDKIALFADVEPEAVISNEDVPDVYLVPEALHDQGLDDSSAQARPAARRGRPRNGALTRQIEERSRVVEIALVGKYVKLHDAYLSVHEALKHAGIHHGCYVQVRWVDAEGMSLEEAGHVLEEVDGVLVPGGFGSAAGRARSSPAGSPASAGSRTSASASACTSPSPSLHGMSLARGRELDRDRPRDSLPGHRPAAPAEGGRGPRRHHAARCAGRRARRGDAGAGDIRRGGHPRASPPPLRGQQPSPPAARRGRTRRVRTPFYEGRLVEIVELPDHPWFVASQFHPEFKSRPMRPAPLFRDFVGAALERRRGGVPAAPAPVTAARRRGLASTSSWSSRDPEPARRGARGRRPRCGRASRPRARGRRGRRRSADRVEHREPPLPALADGGGRHTDLPLRPPRHRPPAGGIEPVVEDGVVRNAGGTILGADDKAAVAVMIEGARRLVEEGRPHAGVELLFTPKEEVGLRGAPGFRRRTSRRPARVRLRPGRADRRDRAGRSLGGGHRPRVPRPGRPCRHVPGGGPPAVAAAARAIADFGSAAWTTRRPPTSAGSRAAGRATSSLPGAGSRPRREVTTRPSSRISFGR